MRHLKKQKRFVFWLCFVILAFLTGTSIMLSVVQPSQLKMEVFPHGYPPFGEPWKITVWERRMLGSDWIKCSNSSVILSTETGERYIFYTDMEGKVEIKYQPEYGKVGIEAVKEGFRGTEWIPAYRFVDLNIVIAFYTVFVAISGATIKVAKGFFKIEKGLSAFARSIGYSITAMQIFATFLAGIWFWSNYQSGLTWGFSSVIFGPLEFEHLILLSGSLILLIALHTLIKKGSWNILREEWKYPECKISVLLTLAMLLIVSIILFTGHTLSFPPIYRYILTTFVSLLAIVPAVSLAVIGISTSGYSVKLARIYRSSVYFWYLLFIFVIIILISMFGLLFSDKATPTLNTITPILSAYGILYLVPYFLAMMRLLDPKKAIGKLGQQISPEYLIHITKHKTLSLVPPPEDPLFPVTQISMKAIKERDMEILQLALGEIVRRYAAVLKFLENLRPQQESTFGEVTTEAIVTGKMREIVEHFISHLRSLAEIAFKEKYERAIASVIEYFKNFAEETMKYRFIEAFRGDSMPSFSWIYEIYNSGVKCLPLSFWDGAASSLRALSNLSEVAMQHEYYDLQHGIVTLIKELSLEGIPYSPRYFFPGEALHGMSDATQSRMKYGVYDFSLESEIEDTNLLSLEVLKKPYLAIGQLLSRCYEKLLTVAFFDYYVIKGKEPGSVAKVIWDVLPIKYLHLETLKFLVQDRTKRKISFVPSDYSPERALKDLIRNGLGKAAEQAALKKEVHVSEICSTLKELSRISYKFEDEELIREVCSILKKTYLSAENPNDIQIAKIPAKLFAMGYACTFSGLESSALEIISYLKSLASLTAGKSSRPETSMRIAFLVEYLGAAAIDMKSMNVAKQALNATIEFEENYTKNYGSLPRVNHIELLVRQLKGDAWHKPYSIQEEGWLYRLFGDEINTEKIVSDKALDLFYTMYLFRKLPGL